MKNLKVLIFSLLLFLAMSSPVLANEIQKIEKNPDLLNLKVFWGDSEPSWYDGDSLFYVAEWRLDFINGSGNIVGSYLLDTNDDPYLAVLPIRTSNVSVPGGFTSGTIKINAHIFDYSEVETDFWYYGNAISYPSGIQESSSMQPSAPSGLTGKNQSQTSIEWQWLDNSTTETGFRVYSDTGVLLKELGINTTSWIETGLTPNTSYTRYVKSFNAYGESSSSNIITVSTLPIPVPASPSDFQGVADSPNQITWSWTDNSNNEYGFRIYDGNNNLIITLATDEHIFVESGLEPNTDYVRYVKAYNGTGESGMSAQVTVKTLPQPPPASPTDFAGVSQGSDSITWTWTDNSTDETGFILVDGQGTVITTLSANTTVYEETGLTADTEYTRYVRAYNVWGQSGNSNQGVVRTLAEELPPPTNDDNTVSGSVYDYRPELRKIVENTSNSSTFTKVWVWVVFVLISCVFAFIIWRIILWALNNFIKFPM